MGESGNAGDGGKLLGLRLKVGSELLGESDPEWMGAEHVSGQQAV